MKSLTFLLIPLLFLSSCSIDWNDEKDKEIARLEYELKQKTDKYYEMKEIIHECNKDIYFAQSYAWGTYEEMENTLNNLQGCEID